MNRTNKEKFWQEEFERETIKMFKYIIDNIKGNIELVPNYDGDNDFAVGIGMPWVMIDIGGHKIFYKNWIKLDANVKLLVKTVRRETPGMSFVVKDTNNLEILVYSKNIDEDAFVRYMPLQPRDIFFKKASKKLNVKISSF